jgi:glycosyltransferase involved in cell wall biosynthesis
MSERRLRVAVDARCLNVEHLRGMGKALFELVKRTASSGAIEWHLLGDRPDWPMHAPQVQGCNVSVFETPGYRFHSWEQWSLPNSARRLGADLLYLPATSMPWWQPVPSIVTINDVIPWHGQDAAWPAGFYRDRLLPSAYHRASSVITISNTSRRDIVARWPDLQERLHVVSLGVDERYLDASPDRQPIAVGGRVVKEPYLLFLGGADPRKRLMWAIQTWLGLSKQDVPLLVCGLEPGAHESLLASVPHERRDSLVLAPFVSEADMPRVYMHAAAVLYPSLYEGFGLPAIEAQAVGTPVLFSDVGSLSELKGPGAVVLPTDDLAAWVRAVEEILQSTTPGGPNQVARAWAQQYSWDAYTDRTLAVFRSVANDQRRR